MIGGMINEALWLGGWIFKIVKHVLSFVSLILIVLALTHAAKGEKQHEEGVDEN